MRISWRPIARVSAARPASWLLTAWWTSCLRTYAAFEAAGTVSDLTACAGGDTLACAASAIPVATTGGMGSKVDEVVGIERKITVDTSRVRRGTPEYDLLNNPPPNARIELDNGTVFRTNEAGYVEEITYIPVNRPNPRCRHGGTCDRFNLFPQNAHFNNSAYRRWENEITRALQNGDEVGPVTVRFERADPRAARPDVVDIVFSINGVPDRRRFLNLHGGGQ